MAVDDAGVGSGRRLRTWLACALVVGSVSGFFATAVTSSPASASTPFVNETARLIGSDSSGNFGRAVSAARDTVVVGDPSHSAVYIYTRPAARWSGSLQETAKLTRSAPNFGAAVAISS